MTGQTERLIDRSALVTKYLDDYSLDSPEWTRVEAGSGVVINGAADRNEVYCKGNSARGVKILFMPESRQSRVFLDRGIRGSLEIYVLGENSTIYIGKQCRLNKTQIRSFQDNDFIAIGSNVSATSRLTMISGLGSGEENPSLIVGDDVMFAHDITVRNSDGHPILDLSTLKQINQPRSDVIIEPHVWVGQNVSILKNVTVGANSIIAAGTVVTQSVPRFSVVRGVPGIAQTRSGRNWARSHGEAHLAAAVTYAQRFGSDVLTEVKE